MKLSITIEGQCGLTWPRWKRFVSAAEDLGFTGLFRSDHFTLGSPPDLDSLEMMVSLGYLASHSRRIEFGPLVAPFSFRDPVMLARQAMAIDDLSGGRMILGVGAGWMEREHTMFGYDLGDIPTRLARLEEGLQVVTGLIRGAEPVSLEGRFYQLREAHLFPRPARPTRVMVGGKGPRRTLPLVARYADIWNVTGLSPEGIGERSAVLDQLLRAQGRAPGDVRRTAMLPIIMWRDKAELARRLSPLGEGAGPYFGLSSDEIVDRIRNNPGALLGAPEEIIARIEAFAAAGIDEVMLQWVGMDDIEGLEAIAETLLPRVTG